MNAILDINIYIGILLFLACLALCCFSIYIYCNLLIWVSNIVHTIMYAYQEVQDLMFNQVLFRNLKVSIQQVLSSS